MDNTTSSKINRAKRDWKEIRSRGDMEIARRKENCQNETMESPEWAAYKQQQAVELKSNVDNMMKKKFGGSLDRISTVESKSSLPNLTCFITMFPLAMEAIANVHDYNRGPLLKADYTPSLLRHLFSIGQHSDHDAAVAWNAIARLEMKLRDLQDQSAEYQQSLRKCARSITG